MSDHPPAFSPDDGDGLHFELHVYPEAAARPWRAELLDHAGRHHAFTTPLELIRHLARLGSPPTGRNGLR